jgi:hypothetical protein
MPRAAKVAGLCFRVVITGTCGKWQILSPGFDVVERSSRYATRVDTDGPFPGIRSEQRNRSEQFLPGPSTPFRKFYS